jgi:hypothetical protein
MQAYFLRTGMIFVLFVTLLFHSQISIIMSSLAIIGIAIQAIPVFFIIKTSISMIKRKKLS